MEEDHQHQVFIINFNYLDNNTNNETRPPTPNNTNNESRPPTPSIYNRF